MRQGHQQLLYSALLLAALLGGWPAACLQVSAATSRAGSAAHARPHPRKALLQVEQQGSPAASPLAGSPTGASLSCQALAAMLHESLTRWLGSAASGAMRRLRHVARAFCPHAHAHAGIDEHLVYLAWQT